MQNTTEEQLASGAISQTQTPVYEPDANGNLVEAKVEETQTQEPPVDPIAAAAIRVVQEAMKECGVEDCDSWLGSLDNAIFTPGIEEAHCIFLINRALRLLTLERRDTPEKDRNAALMGIVDVKSMQFWLPALKAVTFPFFAKYKVGEAGLKFTPGQEPQWLKTATAINQAATAPAADAAPCSTEPA